MPGLYQRALLARTIISFSHFSSFHMCLTNTYYNSHRMQLIVPITAKCCYLIFMILSIIAEYSDGRNIIVCRWPKRTYLQGTI